MPHIISVDNKSTFLQFLREGYIGVRLPKKYYRNTKQKSLSIAELNALLATIYDIFADLKRVKKDDQIFIHVKGEQKIFGAFRAESTFLENPSIPEEFRSSNLLKEKLVNKKLPSLSESDFLWQISIKSDEGLYFDEGFDANEVFKLKDLCKGIWTIPERWKYEDKEKTVRPLLPEEGKKLIELLRKNNPKGPSNSSVFSKNLSNFKKIELPLVPINGLVRDEKLMEAWIMANAFEPEDLKAHENIKNIFGDFSFIANTIRSFYIKFMDVFGFLERNDCRIYKIIELKTKEASFEHINQLVKYMVWIAEFLCENNLSKVYGYLCAKEFSSDAVKFLQENKPTNLELIRYTLSDKCLIFHKFIPNSELTTFFRN
ncbi:MAG: hypothetical protein QXQ94_02160 [Candidatus Bathyarchaeia archaeon]